MYTFQDHCDNGLFTITFHLPYHLTKDLRTFESMERLYLSRFEGHDALVKRACRHMSPCLTGSTAQIMGAVNQYVVDLVTATIAQFRRECRQDSFVQHNLNEEVNYPV